MHLEVKRLDCVANGIGTCNFGDGSLNPADATGPAIVSQNVDKVACIDWFYYPEYQGAYGAVQTCIQPDGNVGTLPLEYFVSKVGGRRARAHLACSPAHLLVLSREWWLL